MNEQQFKERTQAFALRIINLVEALPRKPATLIIGKQLLRSATSVGANYRAACRGKSIADVIAKLSVVEEADECLYWMELLIKAEVVPEARLSSLLLECDEILAMTVASIKTLRKKQQTTSVADESQVYITDHDE